MNRKPSTPAFFQPFQTNPDESTRIQTNPDESRRNVARTIKLFESSLDSRESEQLLRNPCDGLISGPQPSWLWTFVVTAHGYRFSSREIANLRYETRIVEFERKFRKLASNVSNRSVRSKSIEFSGFSISCVYFFRNRKLVGARNMRVLEKKPIHLVFPVSTFGRILGKFQLSLVYLDNAR